MQKKISLFLLSILMLSAGLHSSQNEIQQLNANNDHGLWLEEVATQKLGHWQFILHTEQRWGSDYRLFWYQEYEGIVLYDLSDKIKSWFNVSDESIFKKFEIGPGFTQYSQIQKNHSGNSKWAWVSRPLIESNMQFSWKDWVLKQRTRAEYQIYNTSHYDNYATGRFRSIILTPWKFTCLKINPYISNEIFVRENKYSSTQNPNGVVGGFYENRFRVGLELHPFTESLTTMLYWQWRILKQKPHSNPNWNNTYQFGLLVKYDF